MRSYPTPTIIDSIDVGRSSRVISFDLYNPDLFRSLRLFAVKLDYQVKTISTASVRLLGSNEFWLCFYTRSVPIPTSLSASTFVDYHHGDPLIRPHAQYPIRYPKLRSVSRRI
jgi:hypothetical protein